MEHIKELVSKEIFDNIMFRVYSKVNYQLRIKYSVEKTIYKEIENGILIQAFNEIDTQEILGQIVEQIEVSNQVKYKVFKQVDNEVYNKISNEVQKN